MEDKCGGGCDSSCSDADADTHTDTPIPIPIPIPIQIQIPIPIPITQPKDLAAAAIVVAAIAAVSVAAATIAAASISVAAIVDTLLRFVELLSVAFVASDDETVSCAVPRQRSLFRQHRFFVCCRCAKVFRIGTIPSSQG